MIPALLAGLPVDTVAVASHGAAALAYLALSALVIARTRPRGTGLVFPACIALTAVWATLAALAASAMPALWIAADLADTLRIGAWLTLLALLLTQGDARAARRQVGGAVAAAIALALCLIAAAAGLLGSAAAALTAGAPALAARLMLPVAGLILIENLARNSARDGLYSGKFLFVGLGASFAYDLFVDAHALLFHQLDADLLAPRGAIQVLVAPLLVVAAARNPGWSLELHVSRRIVFHSAALMGSGLFLLLMAAAGYYLRRFGGSWGTLLQACFLAGAGILLAVVVSSGRARGQLRVFINKHFFRYSYDYRVEWHRFIDRLAGVGRSGPLRERVIEAVADIMDSPGGALWLRPPGAAAFTPAASRSFPLPAAATEPGDGALAGYLEATGRIVVLPPDRCPPDQRAPIALPAWLGTLPEAWLIVPLAHHDRLLGFLVLGQPRAPRRLGWEDWDLLRTVGRQAASHLAEQEAIQAVADARQLEAFNRQFAFVVHDLKNLVSPLALLLANARQHADNPAFQEDLLATVGDSVTRMKRMLSELGAGPRRDREPTRLDVSDLLDRVARERASPALAVLPVPPGLAVEGDADGLVTAIGHLVQNAVEAVRGTGRVELAAAIEGDQAVVTVRDDGPGMTAAFVRDELFRPLSSTKTAGYGIGAFQARELILESGGSLDVESEPGRGTTMRIRLPAVTAGEVSSPAGGRAADRLAALTAAGAGEP